MNMYDVWNFIQQLYEEGSCFSISNLRPDCKKKITFLLWCLFIADAKDIHATQK